MKENNIDEKELEEFINEVVKKDITQEDSINKELLDEQLGGMGFLWETVQNKLHKDAICFSCKAHIDFSGGKLHLKQATKVEPGVVAFVSLCDSCNSKK